MSATPITPADTPYAGKEQITSLSTEKSLTLPSGARWAILVPESQAVRINLGGATPTSADMLIGVGVPVEVATPLTGVRLLEEAASAKVNVWYFG